MWSLFNCYLSGRHEFNVWCEPGAIFLRCIHCGRRSSGWAVESKVQSSTMLTVRAESMPKVTVADVTPAHAARVLPFDRAAS